MTPEQLRRRYEPKQVRLLFVGESPPASGRFFYARNSGLYRAMLCVFAAVDPTMAEETFPDVFQASGCYLVDLCADPVDRLAPAWRRAACKLAEASLAAAITRLRPERIAVLLRSIDVNVANAIARTSWEGETIRLPYPGRWEHLKVAFVDQLTPVIAGLIRRKDSGAGQD